jgi:FKBP-type peptidyl-prolyl cis-trans isomerase FkpA
MKKLILAVLIASSILLSCKGQDKPAEGEAPKASKKDVSYAFGVAIGNSLKEAYVSLDYSSFLKGIKDVLDKDKPAIDMEKAQELIQTAVMEAQEKRNAENAEKEKTFLAENGKKDGVKTTESGLQYVVLSEGSGVKPKATDTVKVHYTGTFTDGKTFDSSVERGEPAEFVVEEVIPGWVEALQLMPVGSKYKLFIPSALAYGEEGAGGVIPPFSTLVFEVELLSIEKAK